MELERYPITYRAAEVRQIMDWIKAGQSGCIVGLHGGGKSNILYFLLDEKARRHYLGPGRADFLFVLVNMLALTECTEWATCELILDRLLGEICPPAIESEVAEEVTALHREAMQARDLFTAERALERCVDTLCQRPGQRVVMLFSDFDAVFQALGPHLFRCLRAIYEAHKGQVSYIVVVASELDRLRDNLAAVDPFYRLVGRNVCYLGPFYEADAQYVVRYEAALRSAELDEADVARLVALSGGHAGTIKAILSLLWDTHRGDSLAELALSLEDEPTVQVECRKLWGSLAESEQAALCTLAAGRQTEPTALGHLQRRGLVQESQTGPRLFSPLFAAFVRRQAPPPVQGTLVSRSPRIVQIEGRQVKDLTELEFELLCYLYEQRGRVCSKDELIEHVYRRQYERMAGGVSDEALHALVSRLRAKIEPDRERPVYVVTVRREGYKFVEPGER